MKWNKLLIIPSVVLLFIIFRGCVPESSKDDLKITNIIWFKIDGESYAKIEAEAYLSPLYVTIEPIAPKYEKQKGCTNIINKKGKHIITECLGDPFRQMVIKENATLKICFNYGKRYLKDNRICLDPLIVQK